MPDRPRDTQKSRLYRAQQAMPEYDDPPMPWPDVEAYVTSITRSTWFRARWPHATIRPVQKRGGSAYGYSTGRITLPLFARNRLIICHEIAHTLTPGAWHGPEFCGLYLALVEHFVSRDARGRLRANMREQRVRVSNTAIPKPRPTTPLAHRQRAAAAARRQPLTTAERRHTAELLRRAAAAGQLGPAGRKPREHALAVARQLDPARVKAAATR